VTAHVYRHHAGAYPPLSGDGAKRFGGRWNPPGSFPVIYTALDEPTALAELAKSASRSAIPVEKLRDRRIAVIQVVLAKILDLTDPVVRATLGVELGDILAEDPTTAQRLGAAAHALGYEGVLAPSAASQGVTLAIFADNRSPTSTIGVISDAPM
jgi:RES domain-containing protein